MYRARVVRVRVVRVRVVRARVAKARVAKILRAVRTTEAAGAARIVRII